MFGYHEANRGLINKIIVDCRNDPWSITLHIWFISICLSAAFRYWWWINTTMSIWSDPVPYILSCVCESHSFIQPCILADIDCHSCCCNYICLSNTRGQIPGHLLYLSLFWNMSFTTGQKFMTWNSQLWRTEIQKYYNEEQFVGRERWRGNRTTCSPQCMNRQSQQSLTGQVEHLVGRGRSGFGVPILSLAVIKNVV